MSLSDLGDVPADYKHYSKVITPVPASDLVTDDAHLKWYEIREEHRTVPEAWRASSLEFLRGEASAFSGDLGFVIHHLCGESFYFLLAWTWRNANEVWETVYGAHEGEPLQVMALTAHKEVACVWEFVAVAHEMGAWSRFLRSERDVAAKQAYLDDRYSGPC